MPSSLVLVPPLVVLSLSLVTKRIVEALFAGILVAACIASDFSPFAAAHLTLNKFWEQLGFPAFLSGTGSENVYLFGFLIFLGIFIALLTHTGGTQAYSQLINKTLKSRKNVETSSLILSILCMIDDYFSILTVGSVMRNLAQSFKIPHVKLAFLINSMGPPLCILCPITSWSAMLLGQLSHAGISTQNISGHFTDPFFMYLRIIPYIFYSFIIFCSTWFIVRKRISYGPMHQHELIAKGTGNLFGGKDPVKNNLDLGDKQGTLVDFIFPIFFLMVAVIITILASGHYFGTQNIGIARALSQANIFYALCVGSLCALLLSALWYVTLGKCTIKELVSISRTGCTLMMQSIIVLILANIFSDFIKTDLATSSYVAHYLTAFMNISYFPFTVFLISLLISATTGSSWGAIAIMVPLSIPILASLSPLHTITQIPLLLPAIGAILSGSIAGTHISPLADNMVMASLSTGTYHTDHVKTQIWYSMPSIIGCAVSFLVIGLLAEWHRGVAVVISLLIGIAITLSLLTLLHRYQEKKDNSKS